MCKQMRSQIQVLFGKSVRKLRLKRRLSQERLAELCGLHTNYIGRIERGQQSASVAYIVKLARALKVRPGDLFKGIR